MQNIDHLDETARLVIGTALRKMFESNRFSICTVDDCLKVAGVIAPKQPYQLLHALHCVEWGAMPPELRKRVPGLVADCFNGLRIEDLLAACAPPSVTVTIPALSTRAH